MGRRQRIRLKQYGFGFGELNRLHEHGLIISDYDSWYETFRFPIFQFQKQRWVVVPTANQQASLKFRIEGPALSLAGRELSRVVDCMPIPNYEQSLSNFLLKQKLMMEPCFRRHSHTQESSPVNSTSKRRYRIVCQLDYPKDEQTGHIRIQRNDLAIL